MNARLARSLTVFEPRGLAQAFGRSMLALATLSVLVFNPDGVLFAYSSGLPDGVRCDGLRALSLWCAGSGHPSIPRVCAIVVLVLVFVGYRPQWTCLPHWYVAFSFAESVSVPNGGDEVVQITTMLIIPACWGDRRRWHWTRPEAAISPAWRGAAYAAHITLRAQASVIYFTAAASKLLFPRWRDGTAVFHVFNDPNFGLPLGLREAVAPALASLPVIAALTWGAVATEVALALLVLGGRKMRRVALLLGVMLHGAIALLLGLPSFGLSMIALLTILCVGVPASVDAGGRAEPGNIQGAPKENSDDSGVRVSA